MNDEMKRRLKWENRPYPEIVEPDESFSNAERKTWTVIDMEEAVENYGVPRDVGGAASRTDRAIYVPLTKKSDFINMHELAHVRWSPDKPPRVRYPMQVLQAVEDARVNMGLSKLKLMPPTYEDEIFGDIERATIMDCLTGQHAEVVLRAVSMLGTPGERRMRSVLKDLPPNWSALALDWMRRVESELAKDAKKCGSAVGRFAKARKLAQQLAEELAIEQQAPSPDGSGEDQAQGDSSGHSEGSNVKAPESNEASEARTQAESSSNPSDSKKNESAPNATKAGNGEEASNLKLGEEDETEEDEVKFGPAPKIKVLNPNAKGVKRKKPNLVLSGKASHSLKDSANLLRNVTAHHRRGAYRNNQVRAGTANIRYKIGNRFTIETPTLEDCRARPSAWEKTGPNAWRPQWPKFKMEEPKMDRRLGKVTSMRSRMPSTSTEGYMIRRPDRYLIDGSIFRKSARGVSVAVLVDQSGSMRLSSSQVEQICLAAGGNAIVAGYAGWGFWHAGPDERFNANGMAPESLLNEVGGIIRVIARNDRMVAPDQLMIGYGGNSIDLPALQWLARFNGPKVWVSDGFVVGFNGSTQEHWVQCHEFARRNRIVRVPNAHWAIKYLQQELTNSIEKKLMGGEIA